MRRVTFPLSLSLALALFGPSCVSFSWHRERDFHEPAASTVDRLRPGESVLADCLSELGAPLYVWEWQGDGMALAWGWSDEDQKGLAVSVPVADRLSASMSYLRGMEKLHGLVLFFDSNAALISLRHGRLSEIHEQTAQKRPVYLGEAGS